jgi:broad-specificity NMP kinase
VSDAPADRRVPTDPGAQLQHLLPESVSEAVFRRDIVPTLLAHAVPQSDPTVIVLNAQPGAGKTAVARLLRAEFGADDAVAIEVDGLKAFHPEIDALRRDLGEVAADELVHADARRWLEKSLDYLANDRRVNVVVEHRLRNPQVTDELLTRFSAAGYRIEAALLTTPAAVSMQGVLLRYQAGHERGSGRDIAPELHEQRYQGLLTIADALSADPRVDVIRLYQRDGAIVHRVERGAAGEWDSPISALEALDAERRRPWTVEESRAFLDAHEGLESRMGPAWRLRLQACLAAAKPLLHPEVAAASGGTAGRRARTAAEIAALSFPSRASGKDGPLRGSSPRPGRIQRGSKDADRGR